DAIAWLIKHAPELKDSQIAKLIGTTKDTIGKVRDRSHWNTQNIQARHPVLLGLCNQLDLDQAIIKAGGSTEPAEAQVETLSELP
ncbi:MAG: cell cycle transcriptional regulator TrcR, partial [Pseudomonadota bacterium]|nr:cell cycle transcriptional regulator TrcR [Pseudomonadota bacterium]